MFFPSLFLYICVIILISKGWFMRILCSLLLRMINFQMLANGLLLYLMKINNILVLHFGEDVDLLLDVLHGDAAPAGLHPFLLDVLGGILRPANVHHNVSDESRILCFVSEFLLSMTKSVGWSVGLSVTIFLPCLYRSTCFY